MSDWATYQIQDFIPYTAEVYLRLLERVGETYWPLHLMFISLGLAAIYSVIKGRPRTALLLVAPVWLFVGISYFGMHYSEINWVGRYIAWAFTAQFILLIVISLRRVNIDNKKIVSNAGTRMGLIMAVAGLLVYPVLAPLSGYSWFQVETFGLHPAPTAITTLGIVLMVLTRWPQWIALTIPFIWLVFSGLYVWTLNIPWAIGYFIALGWVLIAILIKALSTNSKVDNPVD